MTVPADNILVVLPNWVGDVVLATPALRALRQAYPGRRIVYLLRQYLAELVSGAVWYDELVFWPGRDRGHPKQTLFNLMKRLRAEKFDLAVLFANSFRAALTTSLAKIPRRVGYDRDGRGMMLTDKLLPDPYDGRFLPISALKYYLSIADYLGCRTDCYHLELAAEPHYEAEVRSLFIRYGLDPKKGIAVMNPGASFGPAKCWPPEYFAEVADRLIEEYGLNVVLTGGPRDIPITRRVAGQARNRVAALTDPVIGLGTLKALIKHCSILVTNDTGPRHVGAAFDVPVVTLFGSTDPRWTETLYVRERQVRIEVDCGPCMKRSCPHPHHRCMRDLRPEYAMKHIRELLGLYPPRPVDQTDPARS